MLESHECACCLLSLLYFHWLFPLSAREISPMNLSIYKSTRERVDSKSLHGRWRLHLMGSCSYVIPNEASSWVIWLIRVNRLIRLKGWRRHGPGLRWVYFVFVTLIHNHRLKLYLVWIIKAFLSSWSKPTLTPVSWDPFLKSPVTFRVYFEWHNSSCIFKTETFQGTKLCKCFYCFLILKTW